MKAKDLIKELQKFDPETDVLVIEGDNDPEYFTAFISEKDTTDEGQPFIVLSGDAVYPINEDIE